jgi:hypothetical protein
MYRERELLSTPSDDTKLWRYLDLSYFLWLLSRQSLYFANRNEFDDQWEGAIPAGTDESLKRTYRSAIRRYGVAVGVDTSQEELEPERLQAYQQIVKSQQTIYGVNCWHKNEVESVAMWRLYTKGKDGVAIQTTVMRLKDCLSLEPRPIFIAEVKYRDHRILPEEGLISHDPLIPLVTKRQSFAHESEVRLILDRHRDTHPVAGQVFSNEEDFGPATGETVAVNVRNLIVRIVASPDYPEWARASLQERVAAAGLEVTVEKSDLITLPETPRLPHIDHLGDLGSASDPK